MKCKNVVGYTGFPAENVFVIGPKSLSGTILYEAEHDYSYFKVHISCPLSKPRQKREISAAAYYPISKANWFELSGEGLVDHDYQPTGFSEIFPGTKYSPHLLQLRTRAGSLSMTSTTGHVFDGSQVHGASLVPFLPLGQRAELSSRKESVVPDFSHI